MSLRLRLKYQWRSLRGTFYGLALPSFFTGRAARLLLAFLLVVSAGAYVLEVSALTTGGYEVERLEQRRADLDSQTKQLETELAATGSLANIAQRVPELGMVPAGAVVRFKIVGATEVAKR